MDREEEVLAIGREGKFIAEGVGRCIAYARVSRTYAGNDSPRADRAEITFWLLVLVCQTKMITH